MEAYFPTSFLGHGEAKPYFERFGHTTHRMTRVAVNCPLPEEIGPGFAEVQDREFKERIHPIIPASFGKHFARRPYSPS